MPSPKIPWWRRWFGTRSEGAAARYLKSLGYRIVARNHSNKLGELDLIALDAGTIVFVVKVPLSTEDGDPLDRARSVDHEKQRRLTRLALAFLKRKRLLDRPARFDVMILAWPTGQRTPTIEHFKNAFEAVGRHQMYT